MKKWLTLAILFFTNGIIVAQNDYPKLEKPPDDIFIDFNIFEGDYVIVYLKRYWIPAKMRLNGPPDSTGVEPIMYYSRIFEGIAQSSTFGNNNGCFIGLDRKYMFKSDTGWGYKDTIELHFVVFQLKPIKLKNEKVDMVLEGETGRRLRYQNFYATPKYEKALILDFNMIPELNYYSHGELKVVREKRKKRLKITYGRSGYRK